MSGQQLASQNEAVGRRGRLDRRRAGVDLQQGAERVFGVNAVKGNAIRI